MDPVFGFYPAGELEDDKVDAEEVELGGNSNPLVSTNANVVDVQDDIVVEVKENRLKRKLPPKEPKPKKERYRSPTWDHFNEIKEGGVTKLAECKYYKKQYKAESKKHGFSNLKAHIPACPLYPNRDQHGQQNLSFKPTNGGGVDVVSHVFSFDDCKRVLAEMVIIDELRFRFVEGIGFRKFCKVMQPKFSLVPSRLKDRNESILHIRDVVSYVRSSPQRLESFKKWVEKEKIVSNQTVRLDVCTRWNSTYLMLEVAVKFEKAFQRMAEEDSGKEVAEEMEKRVKGVLDKLYDAYANKGEIRVQVASATPSGVVDEGCDDRLSLASEFDTYLEQEYSSVCSSEVDKYVNDLCERKDFPEFDILLWWKNNSDKYPILSQVARDVLAIPVSTVASESAFSMGGHVLDPFRSSLSPSMVETLVCTQNWLISTVPISLRQAMAKVEDLEREILGNDASSEVPKD
ncbi:hypothetical protein RHSIM_Rhsim04G0141100 [Rhododendron simsii]|uniref:HAT C-terminal dimerisation domain-containing protein n=1 Tax=Rhododendron simsii TaxID=118357 RepID=A0A834H2Q6_RHOSS|nr:hypothetical protein RHSIM_Rhsim04G0141100 [Rhododendron simsii]